MKPNTICIVAVVLAIATSSFIKYHKKPKTDTYFFVYDATGQHLIYPQYPNYPPSSNPVSCGVPQMVRCVAEYSSFTINPYTWPAEFRPTGILLSISYKPSPF